MKKLLVALLIVALSVTMLFASGAQDDAVATDGKIVLKAYMQIDPADSQY